MDKQDLNIETLSFLGRIIVSTIINGQRVKRIYVGYSEQDAINHFINENKQQ